MTETRPDISLDTLPRVNLLPPEIAETRRFRRIQVGLGGAVLGAVGIVALLYVGAASGVSNAQTELDSATATNATLQAETAKYRDVTAVYARAASAQAMLTQAMGTEIRFSRFMNDLSLSVPENVWLSTLAFTQSAAAPVASGAVAAPTAARTVPAAPTAGSPLGAAGVGTVTFTGVGFSHDDVAVWLESLASQKGYANPYFTNSTEALLGSRKIVNFTSTANLTPAAYSGRYTKPAGG